MFQLKYSAGLESTGKIEFSLLGFVEDRLLELFAAFRHENVKHIAWLAHSKSKLTLENYQCTLKIDMNNNQSIILKIFHKIK